MNVYPKYYFSTNPSVVRGSCFVIMPFESKYDEVFTVIKDAVESREIGLECKRGDEFLKPHILKTILENIAASEYIIADLTGQNANVFYELGLAHCIKEMDNLVLITQDMQSVPFDLRQYRCIAYEQSISGSKKLKQDIISTLQENIGAQFSLTLNEKELFPLPKRLSGNNYLYEIKILMPFIGDDAVKSQIYFTKCKADGTKEKLVEQDLFLQIGQEVNLENIPWHIRLLRIVDGKAILNLRKAVVR